jgi:signal transduction histidine kinase
METSMDKRHFVLIVDDTPENLRVLGEILEQQGYEVLVVTNGPDALEIARQTPSPDLILLDIMMPGMDGYEVCRRLKTDPYLQHIPVIFISAMDMTKKVVQGFHEGAVDYVTKPFQAEVVVSRVRTHIQLSRMEELHKEIEKRIIAEEELHHLNSTLEDLVAIRTAQLKEANECLESFCSSISHDLRNPMARIYSLCEILSEKYADKFDSECGELLAFILASAQNMSDRIQALLAFSRLNREELSIVPVDLSQMACTILNSFCTAEPDRKVTFTIQNDVVVQADPRLICSVMENLLSNAWKYSGKTPDPHIEFGTEHSRAGQVLFVRDNGAGFSMANADKLFGMFQRFHDEKDFTGDGIGLASVKRIITLHGGRIWAEAEPGKGATFRFTLARNE